MKSLIGTIRLSDCCKCRNIDKHSRKITANNFEKLESELSDKVIAFNAIGRCFFMRNQYIVFGKHKKGQSGSRFSNSNRLQEPKTRCPCQRCPLFHENVSPHTAVKTKEKLENVHWETLKHPSYRCTRYDLTTINMLRTSCVIGMLTISK